MPNKADLENPGYTPSRADLEEVLSWLLESDETTSKLAERALFRAGLPAAKAAIAMRPAGNGVGRIRIYRLVGRIAQNQPDRALLDALVEGLADEAKEVQRSAIVALGKLPRASLQGLPFETRLLEMLVDAQGPERRALIEALGKVGGADADDALAKLDPDTDFERQLLEKARLCLMRQLERVSDTDRVNFDVALEDRFTLSLGFRRGLGRIVTEQLRPELRAELDGPTRARVRHFRGPLSACFRSRSLLGPAIELPIERADDDSEQIDRILDVLTCEQVVRLLERLSSTRPRLRFSLSGEGHRRAFLWALSERLHNVTTRLSANPRGALWEVKIELTESRSHLPRTQSLRRPTLHLSHSRDKRRVTPDDRSGTGPRLGCPRGRRHLGSLRR
ncbi:MAG: HEAT repeat domain-containing protein [Polyangiaceae bacterium]